MKDIKGKRVVAIYIRVSSDDQKREGLSLDIQRKRLNEYCKNKDWDIYKIYEDAGISAKSIKGRKAFSGMLEDSRESKFSAIVITKLDRAFRNVKDAINTSEEFEERGIDLISLHENIDTTTAMGKFFFIIMSALAQLEREITSERVNEVLEDKFDVGHIIGKAPIGYKWNKKKKCFIIDSKKAEMVKDIFKMTIEGINWKDICKKYELNIKTYYNIIKNKAYIGIINYLGVEKEGIHEKIITKEEFFKINRP